MVVLVYAFTWNLLYTSFISVPHKNDGYEVPYFNITLSITIGLDIWARRQNNEKLPGDILARLLPSVLIGQKAQHPLTKKRLKYQTCLRHLWSVWPQPMLKWSTYIIVHLCELHTAWAAPTQSRHWLSALQNTEGCTKQAQSDATFHHFLYLSRTPASYLWPCLKSYYAIYYGETRQWVTGTEIM